jgi:hypothetical protein
MFFEKTVFFFYSRISVKNAIFLNIQKSWVKIQSFTEKNTVFALITYPPGHVQAVAKRQTRKTIYQQGFQGNPGFLKTPLVFLQGT